ncbi:hypothetical protein ES705_44259 [subsurface metagenome]
MAFLLSSANLSTHSSKVSILLPNSSSSSPVSPVFSPSPSIESVKLSTPVVAPSAFSPTSSSAFANSFVGSMISSVFSLYNPNFSKTHLTLSHNQPSASFTFSTTLRVKSRMPPKLVIQAVYKAPAANISHPIGPEATANALIAIPIAIIATFIFIKADTAIKIGPPTAAKAPKTPPILTIHSTNLGCAFTHSVIFLITSTAFSANLVNDGIKISPISLPRPPMLFVTSPKVSLNVAAAAADSVDISKFKSLAFCINSSIPSPPCLRSGNN